MKVDSDNIQEYNFHLNFRFEFTFPSQMNEVILRSVMVGEGARAEISLMTPLENELKSLWRALECREMMLR